MTSASDVVVGILSGHVGGLIARSMLVGAAQASGVDLDQVTHAELERLIPALEAASHTFIADTQAAEACVKHLRSALARPSSAVPVVPEMPPFSQIALTTEFDVLSARNRAKSLCDVVGFAKSEQVKVATVVSELARNIVTYVGDGLIEFHLVRDPRKGIEIRAIDEGSGIPDIDTVLSGAYRSRTGLGMGLLGSKRVMDEFAVETGPDIGTRVVTRKYV